MRRRTYRRIHGAAAGEREEEDDEAGGRRAAATRHRCHVAQEQHCARAARA